MVSNTNKNTGPNTNTNTDTNTDTFFLRIMPDLILDCPIKTQIQV